MAYKPFNLFDTVETPEQAQQRILKQRQEAQKGFTTNQTIGFNLADLIGKAFGGGIGSREKAIAEQRASVQLDSRERGTALASRWEETRQIEDPQARQQAQQEILEDLDGLNMNSNMLAGTTPENARMFALAQTAHVLGQSSNPEDQRLSAQARESLVQYNESLRAKRMEEERLMVSTDASRSQLKESDMRILNSSTPEQIQVMIDAERDPARLKQLQAAQGRAVEAKRARQVEEDRKAEGIRLQRENLELSEAREERIASQLGADERRMVKEADEAYNTHSDEAIKLRELNERVVDVNRYGGKARTLTEQMKAFLGTEEEDITVLQTELEGRALNKAFSYKADAQMSTVEFEAYKRAALAATASPAAWSEFMRLESKYAERLARQAAFTSDYMSGQDLTGDEWGLENNYGYKPGKARGIEGAGTAWRREKEKIYAGIDERYSKENWKSPPSVEVWGAEGAANKYAENPEATKDEQRRKEIENDLRNRYRSK